MKKKDFEEAIEQFNLDMKVLNIDYKYSYCTDERKEIFKLCRKIKRTELHTSTDGMIPVNEASIRPFSIRSLKVFNNSTIVDYFTEKTKNIRIIRDRKNATGEANMEFVKPNSKQTQYTMFLPKGTLYVSDQLSYSHEIGHIPELDLVRKSYLEYTEALPIFMEYLCELRRHPDKKEALDYFLIERLPMEQSEASDILKIYKNTEHPNELVRLYHQQLFADYYKYLESLEFVLQLIDRMDSDKEAVGKEIEAIIMGKSLIETARSLDIETDGCERTLKEYKRMSR